MPADLPASCRQENRQASIIRWVLVKRCCLAHRGQAGKQGAKQAGARQHRRQASGHPPTIIVCPPATMIVLLQGTSSVAASAAMNWGVILPARSAAVIICREWRVAGARGGSGGVDGSGGEREGGSTVHCQGEPEQCSHRCC
jgi:hypothetical protein